MSRVAYKRIYLEPEQLQGLRELRISPKESDSSVITRILEAIRRQQQEGEEPRETLLRLGGYAAAPEPMTLKKKTRRKRKKKTRKSS